MEPDLRYRVPVRNWINPILDESGRDPLGPADSRTPTTPSDARFVGGVAHDVRAKEQ